MVKRFFAALWILTGMLVWLPSAKVHAQESEPTILVITAEGMLTPSMAEYLERGIRIAQQQKAEAIILQLNTPGGELGLLDRMVSDILTSPIPVIVYVWPPGGMAASAGTVITLAGHAAAMAPDTIIGAASPVGGQGEDLGETMEAKAKNAMRAKVRTLAERRSPEAIALAEDTIENAKAVSAEEALRVGLIDFIAADLGDLLRQLDGYQVHIGATGDLQTLRTSGVVIQRVSASYIEQILGTLANPNIVYILLTIGVQAILIEISSPGGWVAGFIGVVCLALAIYGMGILPVNWFGLIFMIVAFVLFILDIKAPTHGALTAAGAGSLIVGALVLFNSPTTPPALRVSPLLIVGTSIFTAATFGLFVTFAIRAQKAPIRTGRESVSGRTGIVRSDLAPRGTVQLSGELWTAELAEGEAPLPSGTRVEVVKADGIKLVVRKYTPKHS